MEHAQKLFSTRGGTLTLALLAAVIAGIAVFAYVTNYRDSVKSGGEPAKVLVAQSLIPEGTAGESVARNELYVAQDVRESQLREGALTDPASLRDRTAVADVYPGQQLTTTDFAPSGSALATTLAPRQRAITLAFDATHGITNSLNAGDRVDVYAIFNVQSLQGGGQAEPLLRLIIQNVHVVDVVKNGDSTSAQLTFRVSPREAAELAFASDNGRLWLTLRPADRAKASPPSAVTVQTLMLGVPPVTVLKSLGARK